MAAPRQHVVGALLTPLTGSPTKRDPASAELRPTHWGPSHWWAWLIAGVIAFGPACRLVNGIDKVSKIPGLEEAQLREGLEKSRGRAGGHGSASALQATPSIVDFGGAPVGSQQQQTLTITNPSTFPVTVLRVSVEGSGFALSGQAGTRVVVKPHEQLAMTVTFQPAAPGACSGHLLLEIDSAGGRFTRVELRGRGI